MLGLAQIMMDATNFCTRSSITIINCFYQPHCYSWHSPLYCLCLCFLSSIHLNMQYLAWLCHHHNDRGDSADSLCATKQKNAAFTITWFVCRMKVWILQGLQEPILECLDRWVSLTVGVHHYAWCNLSIFFSITCFLLLQTISAVTL